MPRREKKRPLPGVETDAGAAFDLELAVGEGCPWRLQRDFCLNIMEGKEFFSSGTA